MKFTTRQSLRKHTDKYHLSKEDIEALKCICPECGIVCVTQSENPLYLLMFKNFNMLQFSRHS